MEIYIAERCAASDVSTSSNAHLYEPSSIVAARPVGRKEGNLHSARRPAKGISNGGI